MPVFANTFIVTITEQVDDPCRNVGCDTSIKYQCPKDSMLTTNTSVSTGGNTAAESCCKNWLACLCNMNLCEVPTCGPGFTPQMTHKGNAKPGNCCDQFECKRNGKGAFFSFISLCWYPVIWWWFNGLNIYLSNHYLLGSHFRKIFFYCNCYSLNVKRGWTKYETASSGGGRVLELWGV